MMRDILLCAVVFSFACSIALAADADFLGLQMQKVTAANPHAHFEIHDSSVIVRHDYTTASRCNVSILYLPDFGSEEGKHATVGQVQASSSWTSPEGRHCALQAVRDIWKMWGRPSFIPQADATASSVFVMADDSIGAVKGSGVISLTMNRSQGVVASFVRMNAALADGVATNLALFSAD